MLVFIEAFNSDEIAVRPANWHKCSGRTHINELNASNRNLRWSLYNFHNSVPTSYSLCTLQKIQGRFRFNELKHT